MNNIVVPMAQQAVAATAFVQSIGINTHIDFYWSAYNDLTAVQNALAYLGVDNVRDAIDNPSDPAKFAELNQNLGIRFDFFIAPGSVGMPWQLQQIENDPAIVRFIEGANESDNWPQTYNGLTGLAATIAEQQALFASAADNLPGVPVIAPSFGHLDSYADVGDLSAYADSANAHVYFGTGNSPGDQNWIGTVLQIAQQAEPAEPIMTTETGYYTSGDPTDPNGVDPVVQAKYLLDNVMDQFKAGATMDYLYELVDEGSDPSDPQDNFGLFTDNWAAKPAAVAIHDLMLLMRDHGAVSGNGAAGTLSYSLTGLPATANSLLFERSDGTFVLAVWNDVRLTGPVADADIAVPAVPVTLTLASTAARIDVFDPLTGTSSIQSAQNAAQIMLSLPDHPVLIEIGPNAGSSPTVPSSPSAPAATPPPPPAPLPIGPVIAAPSSESVPAGTSVAVGPATVTDAFAAANPGLTVLNLSASSGSLTMTDASGAELPGSGTASISTDGTLAQINADLGHLTYTAAAATGSATVMIDVWDPAGLEARQPIAVTIGSPPSPPLPPAPLPVGPVITAPPTESVSAGGSIAVGPIAVADTFAATNPGTAALNLNVSSGSLTVTDASGAKLPGSGTASISVDGTLAQISADLAHLTYTAGSGNGPASIGIDIWNQAGQETSASVGVTVTSTAAPVVVTPIALPVVTLAPTDVAPVITESGTFLNITASGHQILVAGTGNTISALAGSETIMAFLGRNAIIAGGGGNTIRIAGSGNVVNAGGGKNEIDDSGTDNTIVLPPAGLGTDDIFGYVMQNHDTFDLRQTLAGTKWDGSAATIGDFIDISTLNGADAAISVVSAGTAGGAGQVVATLHGSGPVSLAALLAQAIT